MIRQPHFEAREVLIATALTEVVAELRQVELIDYAAFIRLEHFANVGDIVDSAAELFFLPGTLRFGLGGDVHLVWNGESRVVLDLELKLDGVTAYVALTLKGDSAGVDLTYISFDRPSADPDENTALLEQALEAARIRKGKPSVFADIAALAAALEGSER